MAGSPLRRARRQLREAEQLADVQASRPTLPQPRQTPAQYEPALLDELMTLANQGYATAEIAAHWAISEETLDGWAKTHSELAEALSRARVREKAWWLTKAREAIRDDNNRFPAGAWSHIMRARFPEYDDKRGVTVNVDLSALVRVAIPEPLQERVSDAGKALIEHEPVGLSQSLTGTSSNSGTAAGAPCIALPGPDADDDADPQGAGG